MYLAPRKSRIVYSNTGIFEYSYTAPRAGPGARLLAGRTPYVADGSDFFELFGYGYVKENKIGQLGINGINRSSSVFWISNCCISILNIQTFQI